METNVTDFNSLEQGLAGKVSELEAQRLVRETLLVDITLEAIANGVVSKEQDIILLMSGKPLQGRDVTVISDRDAITEWSAAITKMADLAKLHRLRHLPAKGAGGQSEARHRRLYPDAASCAVLNA